MSITLPEPVKPGLAASDFLYFYQAAAITKIYDGDSITALLDLGFNTFVEVTLRLHMIDTPEIRGEEREQGLIVRDYVRKIVSEASEIIVNTYKDRTGKYGRWLAVIYLDGMNLNQHLLDEGMATLYVG